MSVESRIGQAEKRVGKADPGGLLPIQEVIARLHYVKGGGSPRNHFDRQAVAALAQAAVDLAAEEAERERRRHEPCQCSNPAWPTSPGGEPNCRRCGGLLDMSNR